MTRLVVLVVDTHHEGCIDALAGGRDDDLAGAGLEVTASSVTRAELAGALHGDVDGELAPGQLGRRRRVEDRDLVSVDDERVVADLDLAGEGPEGAVTTHKRSQHPRVRQVVDTDDLDVVTQHGLTQQCPADPPESVDADPDHRKPPRRPLRWWRPVPVPPWMPEPEGGRAGGPIRS
jgi:hypothetical protein